MNSKFLKLLFEANVKIVSTENFSKEEAYKYFKKTTKDLTIDDVIFSDRIKSGFGTWINDLTSEAVFSKETPKELLGKYATK